MSKSNQRFVGAGAPGMIEVLEGRRLMSVSGDSTTELLPADGTEVAHHVEPRDGVTGQAVSQVLKTRHDTAKNAIGNVR